MIKDKCSKCGYDKHKGSLHIHHVDGNHNNNISENLMVLCSNCHFELHQTIKLKRTHHQSKEESDRVKSKRVIEECERLREENESLKQEIRASRAVIENKSVFLYKFMNAIIDNMEGYYYHNKRVVNEMFEKVRMEHNRNRGKEQISKLTGDKIATIQEHYLTPSADEMRTVTSEKELI